MLKRLREFLVVFVRSSVMIVCLPKVVFINQSDAAGFATSATKLGLLNAGLPKRTFDSELEGDRHTSSSIAA